MDNSNQSACSWNDLNTKLNKNLLLKEHVSGNQQTKILHTIYAAKYALQSCWETICSCNRSAENRHQFGLQSRTARTDFGFLWNIFRCQSSCIKYVTICYGNCMSEECLLWAWIANICIFQYKAIYQTTYSMKTNDIDCRIRGFNVREPTLIKFIKWTMMTTNKYDLKVSTCT